MRDRIATVFGGSGFLGRYVVRALANDNWRIRVACRRPYLAGHLQPMGRVGQIHAVQANVRHAFSLATPIEDATTVVNLVGISTRSWAQTFEDVNVIGARAVARAARHAGAATFVHISMICADANSRNRLARTRAAGEAAVLEEFPDAIILRPTPIFGAEDQLFNRIAAFARFSPLIPLIGGGRTEVQLIHVGDVAQVVALACAGRAKRGTIYELGGPDVLSCRDLVHRALTWSGRARWHLPVPFWLAKIGAFSAPLIPNGLRPLTLDELALMAQVTLVSDTAILENRTLRFFDIEYPRSIVSIVPQYLERFHPRGQFASYRG